MRSATQPAVGQAFSSQRERPCANVIRNRSGLWAPLSAKLGLEFCDELCRRRELLAVAQLAPIELQRIASVAEGLAEVVGKGRGRGRILAPCAGSFICRGAGRLFLGQGVLIEVGRQQAIDPGCALPAVALRRLTGGDADAAAARCRAERRLGGEIGLK